MSLKHFVFIFILLALTFQISAQKKSIIINEVLASNSKGYSDGFGEHDDWIELYNLTDSSIQLSGMFLTDDPEEPTKHEIGNSEKWTSVESKEFILLWVDNDPEQGQRHISFSLNKKGGYIGLYGRDTVLIDEVYYSVQKRDNSLGKIKVNSDQLAIFSKPSPNEHNEGGLRLNTQNINVDINMPSGFYTGSQVLTLSCGIEGDIHYTLDGSEPTGNSPIYNQVIKLDSSAVLRTCLIQDGFLPNVITNRSFLIDEKSTLSVVSLIVDPKDLWRKKKGIYRNFERRGVEVPAYVEYFDTTDAGEFNLSLSKTAKTRIAGKTSRRQPKKSFAFFANNDDGKGDRFNYPVFQDKNIDGFSGLWIRADATSGRNVPELWVGERFKNELLYEVNKQMNGNIDMQAYQPVSVYLNGEYWGLYNLMERKGKDFIYNNYGEKDVDILTAEDAKIVSGNISEYDQLMFYIAQNDITTDSVYNEVCKQINIDSYIDYWVNETYCGARDINVNIRFWKSKELGSKWKWISYDQDSWYTYKEKSLKYYLDKGKVFFLGRLMKNKTFRLRWINRMCDYLNSGFEPENVVGLVDEITERIEVEVNRDRNRWSDSMLYIPKGQRVKWIKDYAHKRPDFLRQNMIDYFNLSGKVTEVTVSQTDNAKGIIKLNTIYPKGKIWKGFYISDVPISIEAIPNEGYRFVRWKKKKFPSESKITVSVKKFKKFEAVFEKIDP